MHYMGTQLQANTADYLFEVLNADLPEMKVTAFSGSEGISQLYHFRVELVCDEPNLDFAPIVGKPCELRILAECGTRYVHGMVRAFQRTGEGSCRTHYTAEIVPCHWLMTRRHTCRIFQKHNCPDMSVPGIVQKVLSDAGIPASRLRLALAKPEQFEQREYVVQYRETDMDFIGRLMEEEGIFYFFEHSEKNGHVMVLGESPVAHAALPDGAEFPFRAPSGLAPVHEHIFNVRKRGEVQFGAVCLDDFNFARPPMDADMEAGRSADEFTALEFHDYPGRFTDKGSTGERFAQTRLEEFQCQRNVLDMAATVRTMTPGYTFTMTEHSIAALNGAYLITQVTHHATQPQSGEEEAGDYQDISYQVTIQTIPADVVFRPARKTPRPTVQGTQTAIVVGPCEEEIYIDEFGRVKVQFHWDREGKYDENSSCWIRVSQAWAGGEYGAMFLPRVGHEVIVDFLEGDPDRPIIVGRVYNADLRPPITEKHKTRSVIKTQSSKGGGGCNMIGFDDEKDKEVLFFQAEKNLFLRAGNDRFEHIDNDRNLRVGGNRFELIEKHKQGEVQLDFHEKIGGNKSLAVGGSVAEQFGGAHSESCGSYYLTTGKGEVVIESCSAITLKVGGNFVKIHGGGVDIMGSVVNINSGGSPGNGCGAPMGEIHRPEQVQATDPGYDKSYNKNCKPDDDDADAAGEGASEETKDEKKTSWIEIELVDEAGQVWPNEPYEMTGPDGKVYRGTLDAKGQAHVAVEKPGDYQISFTKLDMEAWERA